MGGKHIERKRRKPKDSGVLTKENRGARRSIVSTTAERVN